MKKLILSMFVIAMCASATVSAQDNTKKSADAGKTKTECTNKKEDKKCCSSDKSADSKSCCSDKKDGTKTASTDSKSCCSSKKTASADTKSAGKK